MLDVTTTITINGSEGDRFLSALAAYDAPVPRALRWLASGQYRSIEVDRTDAELVATFVEELLDSGWIRLAEPPLLYSPRVGDYVVVRSDVLAQVGREAAGLPPTWQFIPAGTRGKLVGWRDGDDEAARAVVEIIDVSPRLVVFVGEAKVTRSASMIEHERRARRKRRSA